MNDETRVKIGIGLTAATAGFIGGMLLCINASPAIAPTVVTRTLNKEVQVTVDVVRTVVVTKEIVKTVEKVVNRVVREPILLGTMPSGDPIVRWKTTDYGLAMRSDLNAKLQQTESLTLKAGSLEKTQSSSQTVVSSTPMARYGVGLRWQDSWIPKNAIGCAAGITMKCLEGMNVDLSARIGDLPVWITLELSLNYWAMGGRYEW